MLEYNSTRYPIIQRKINTQQPIKSTVSLCNQEKISMNLRHV